ncbi:MAG: hypothetical protein RLZZ175_1998 [Bacteroidota bacterium]|jgi:iron complex outermembrane receptor protein
MKYLIYILLFWFGASNIALAQNASITGTVTDENNNPVEFVNIKLISLPDSAKVKVQTTNEFGQYRFNELPAGKYALVSLLIGYDKNVSESIILLQDEKKTFKVSIKSTVLKTAEITVTAKRPLVRVEDGKMIVDVENTLSNSGQSAIEVLRKSPGVFIDQDGKIQLKGKSGVQVMLDDKVMYMSEDQLANLLKSIPADQIKEIELITSPSAKYDATGTAGIINIKLKKGAYEGWNGSTNLSVGSGKFRKSSVGANLTYKKNKIFFNTGLQHQNSVNYSDFYNDRNDSDPTVLNKRIYNSTQYEMPFTNTNFNLKGEYKVTEKTSFTFDLNDGFGRYNWHGNGFSKQYNQSDAVRSSFSNKDDGYTQWFNVYTSLGFKHKFDTNATVLDGYAAYNSNFGHEEKLQSLIQFDSLGADAKNPFYFKNNLNYYSNKYNAQLDFKKKLGEKIKIETGIKGVHLDDNNPNNITITQNHAEKDVSNYFIYEENVYAAYGLSYLNFGKWNIQAGLRVENTQTKGTLSLIDSVFTRNYTNLFPTGNITFVPNDKRSHALMYSRRITRPEGDQLNPVLNIIDPYNAWGGDPYLLPQYADNTELTNTFFGGGLVASANYTYVKNPIVWTNKLSKVDNRFINGPRNLEFQKSFGVTISVNAPIFKWWQTSNSGAYIYNQFVGTTDFGKIDNQMGGWTANSTQTFSLPKDFTVEASGMYNSPTSYAFSKSYARWQVNLSVQTKIWKKKASIKLAFNDMFWTFQYGGSNQMGTSFQKSGYRWDNRTVMFTFSYRFGNQLMKSE